MRKFAPLTLAGLCLALTGCSGGAADAPPPPAPGAANAMKPPPQTNRMSAPMGAAGPAAQGADRAGSK